MFSTHKKVILGGLTVSALLVGGCSTSGSSSSHSPFANMTTPDRPVVVKTFEPVAPNPQADEATELRGWTKSSALYESGATLAWPTRWYSQQNPDYSTPVNFVSDPLNFLGQTASLPVTLLIEPPFKKPVIYAGDVMPPTYTANPPFPPEQPEARALPDPDPLSKQEAPVIPAIPPISDEHAPLYVAPPVKHVRPMAKKLSSNTTMPTTMPAH